MPCYTILQEEDRGQRQGHCTLGPTHRDGQGGQLPPLACRGVEGGQQGRSGGAAGGDPQWAAEQQNCPSWALLRRRGEKLAWQGQGEAGQGARGLAHLTSNGQGSWASPSPRGHLSLRLQGQLLSPPDPWSHDSLCSTMARAWRTLPSIEGNLPGYVHPPPEPLRPELRTGCPSLGGPMGRAGCSDLW